MFRSMFKFSIMATVVFLMSTYALAGSPDRFQTNHDIHVGAADSPQDVTCFNCSIFVRGEVNGDVTAIGGNVILEDGARVHGDTTSIVGNIRLEANASAGRDVTAVVGTVRRHQLATVKGDVTAIEGRGWLILVVVLPLALLGGLLALIGWAIVWLVRRSNSGVPVTA